MKTLAELRMEVEMGMIVYPTTNHDVSVWREEANEFHEVSAWRQSEHPWYKLYRNSKLTKAEAERDVDEELGGGTIEHAYPSFDSLLSEWPLLASQPVWSTTKTLERKRYEKAEHERYLREMAEQEARMKEHPPIDVEEMFTTTWADQLRETITWGLLDESIDVENLVKPVIETVLPGAEITGISQAATSYAPWMVKVEVKDSFIASVTLYGQIDIGGFTGEHLLVSRSFEAHHLTLRTGVDLVPRELMHSVVHRVATGPISKVVAAGL